MSAYGPPPGPPPYGPPPGTPPYGPAPPPYGSQPPGPPARTKPVGWILFVVFLLIVVAGAVWAVSGFSSAFDEPDPLIGGELQVAADAGEVLALWRRDGGSSGVTRQCAVTGPGGAPVSLGRGTNATLSINDRSYAVDSTFQAATAGSYTVSCSSDVASRVFVGPPLGFGQIGAGVGGILIAVFAFIAAIVTLIVTLVRRSSRKRRQAPYGPPAAYGPGPYGPPA